MLLGFSQQEDRVREKTEDNKKDVDIKNFFQKDVFSVIVLVSEKSNRMEKK